MDLGDCTANSHVALTKSLRGKLSKLVSFLLSRGTEPCQNWTFSPSLKSSSVKQYLGYVCISNLHTLVGADLQTNIIYVKAPMSTLYPFWGFYPE